MIEQFKRIKMLIGEENLAKLHNSNILLVGVGGVGGFIAEFLIRTGVNNLTIVDFDDINITNLNRQIIALNSTLNLSKVDALKSRLLDINKNANITALNCKLDCNNVESILQSEKFDYVIDAIDLLDNKVSLICAAKKHNMKIISALGTGNRFEMPNFEITDIYKTQDDGLARLLRKKLRENGVSSLDTCFSKNKPCELAYKENNERNVGSIVYYPAMCACMIVAFVVNKIINSFWNS